MTPIEPKEVLVTLEEYFGVVGITALVVALLNGAVFYMANAAGTSTAVSTTAAVKAAKWNPTVKLTYSSKSIIMQPTGIPNHARDAYYAVPKAGVVVPDATTANIIADPTKAQAYKFTIPTTPKYSSFHIKFRLKFSFCHS